MSGKTQKSIENSIKNRVYGHGRGWCMTPWHFRDLGSSEGVRVALHRLAQEGVIRRLAQGIYEYPEVHEVLGTIPADAHKIAKALSEKSNIEVMPSGAYAANLLQFSEQVPAKIVFVTNGSSKKIKIGNREIIFKKAVPKSLAMAGTQMGLVLQALKHLGQKHITPKIEKILIDRLSLIDDKEIAKGLNYAPVWIRKLIEEIIETKKS